MIQMLSTAQLTSEDYRTLFKNKSHQRPKSRRIISRPADTRDIYDNITKNDNPGLKPGFCHPSSTRRSTNIAALGHELPFSYLLWLLKPNLALQIQGGLFAKRFD